MSIYEDIKNRYIRLSKGQRKVAQFVLDHPNVVASNIASEVGRLADVSESTVIRFCYAMDFSGFSELQEKIREYLIEQGESVEIKKGISAKKVKKQLGADVVKQDIAGISKTFNEMNEQDVKEVVQLLHTAARIHILGFRQSAPAAFWLHTNLNMLRDQVHFLQHEADKIAQQLAFMDEDSLLLVISLDDEYEDVATTVDIAKRKNVKVVAIRDKQLTSVQEPASPVLIVPSAKEGGATSSIAIYSLLHILVEALFSENPQQYAKYSEKRKTAKSATSISAVNS